MRALDQAGLGLLVVIGDRAEPGFELVPVGAPEIVTDHGPVEIRPARARQEFSPRVAAT